MECHSFFRVRILIGFLMFLGTMTSYMLRVNLNIAIVQMTDDSEGLCANKTSTESVTMSDGKVRFCWSEWQKSWIKGSFFYGYIAMQVFGGSLAEKFGTKIVLGMANTLTAILSLFIPVVSNMDWQGLLVLRIFQGLAESVTYPCLPPMIMRWAPTNERSKFVTFTYFGGTFGVLVTYPLCGFLLQKYDWETVFYVGGAFGLAWFAIWLLLVTDEPKTHWFISDFEKRYIMSNRQKTMGEIGTRNPPYLAILLTPTVWIAMFSDFANSIASYIVIIEGPNFFKNILDVDISENGVLSAVPHFVAIIYGFIFGFLADHIIGSGCLQKKNTRRLFHGLGFGVPAITSALLGYTTSNWVLCITVLSAGFGFRSAQYAGHYSLVYDIAPKFSGTVYGMVNMVGNSAGFITPILTSAVTGHNPTDVTGWRNLFWISSSLLLAAMLVFVFFATFEPARFEYEGDERDLIGKEVENGGTGVGGSPLDSPCRSPLNGTSSPVPDACKQKETDLEV